MRWRAGFVREASRALCGAASTECLEGLSDVPKQAPGAFSRSNQSTCCYSWLLSSSSSCAAAHGLLLRNDTPRFSRTKGIGAKQMAMAISTKLAFLVPTLRKRCRPTSGKPAPAKFRTSPMPASADAEYVLYASSVYVRVIRTAINR